MRIACVCGLRHKFTTGQAGTSVTCRCGKKVHAPPLRELREYSPQAALVRTFNDESFWQQRGCYLCGSAIQQYLPVTIQLSPPEYAILPPQRRPPTLGSTLLATVGIGSLLGGTAPAERVLTKEAVILQLIFRICNRCLHFDEIGPKCMSELFKETDGQDLRADFPSMTVIHY